LEELCEEICRELEGENVNFNTILLQLKELEGFLSKTTSRFVDIDSSVREDSLLNQKVSNNLSDSLLDNEQKMNLFKIYETLKTYLGLKFKYGEAADWYLKNEFDSSLKKVIESYFKAAITS
jgi:hypothetical protein